MRTFIRSFALLWAIFWIFSIYSCKTTQPAVTAEEVVVDEGSNVYQSVYQQRLQEHEKEISFEFGTEREELTPAQEAAKYSMVQLFYATDRKPSGNAGPYKFYSGKKGKGQLHYGQCIVSIPKIHDIGEIERPLWWKMQFSEDVEKHIVLKKVISLSGQSFFQTLNNTAESADNRDALVFIHGFNTSFDEAAIRLAQIAYDVSFGGIPILYSWPSKGSVLDYWADGSAVEWSVPHLESFLEQLAAQQSLESIHIIAHSMGNRALTQALTDLAKKHHEKLFDQIILAAPDVDAKVFKEEIAPFIRQTANNVTLYASSKDKALLLSKKIHRGPRAGEAGNSLVIVQDLETVDASLIDTDFLGHTYFANTWLLINDLYYVINKHWRADKRKLKTSFRAKYKYWRF